MTRVESDQRLVALLNASIPEMELVLGRLEKDRFLSPYESQVMQEAKRLLEEAAGRLILRQKTE